MTLLDGSETDSATAKQRVLVIDDSPLQLTIVKRLLETAGFLVQTAADGAEGLKVAWGEQPDIVISDVVMPELNGYQVCRMLKDDPVTAHIPIVLLTSLEDSVDRFWAEEAGADRFLNKSSIRGDLIPAARELLASRPAPEVPLPDQRPLAAPNDTHEIQSRAAQLLERLLLDQAITLRFRRVAAYAENTAAAVEQVFDVLGRLIDFHACGLSLQLPGGSQEYAPSRDSCAPARVECPDGARWEVQLDDCGESVGELWVELRRKPGRHSQRLLECIAREVAQAAGALVRRERATLLQQDLAESLRLRGLGQLAGELAHEMNTPAQFVSDNLSFVGECLAELMPVLASLKARSASSTEIGLAELDRLDLGFLCDEVPRALSEASAGVGRMAGIVRALKDMSPPVGPGRALVDVHEAIENALVLSRGRWEPVARIERQFGTGLAPVEASAGDLQQVFVQLIANAAAALADAQPQNGLIRIRTRSSSDLIEVDVEDNGAGMSEEVQKRIVEPIVHGKAAGQARGCGLAFVHAAVVERCQGRVHFTSTSGQGTRFSLELPLPRAHSTS